MSSSSDPLVEQGILKTNCLACQSPSKRPRQSDDICYTGCELCDWSASTSLQLAEHYCCATKECSWRLQLIEKMTASALTNWWRTRVVWALTWICVCTIYVICQNLLLFSPYLYFCKHLLQDKHLLKSTLQKLYKSIKLFIAAKKYCLRLFCIQRKEKLWM